MTPLDHETLTAVARHCAWPSISIYLPTHTTITDKEQDRIRLKNLLREACSSLVSRGMRQPDAEMVCEPVRTLLEDDSFWRESAEGLALFVSGSGVAHVLRLDAPVTEQAVVGDRFFMRPLLTAQRGERRFLALAIDRNGSRFFRGDGGSIEEVALEGIPTSLADELRYDEVQPAVQYSSLPSPASSVGGGRATGAIFHGHGGEKDTDKSNLERYLRKVEGAVAVVARQTPETPLVLLGVEYSLALYRSLNTVPSLAPEQVNGATDELAPHEVHARALEALEPRFAAVIDQRLSELSDGKGSGTVSHDPTVIVPAAAAGRVKMLFLDDSVGPFGTFDRVSHEVDSVCADAPNGDERGWDLVDLAAAETILHGGEVFAFTGDNPPVNGVAAVMRY